MNGVYRVIEFHTKITEKGDSIKKSAAIEIISERLKISAKKAEGMIKGEIFNRQNKFNKEFAWNTPFITVQALFKVLSLEAEEIVEVTVQTAKEVVEKVVEKVKVIATPMFFFCGENQVENVQRLKKEYRKWSKLLHADTSGLEDDNAFKRMRLEYEACLYVSGQSHYESSYEWLKGKMLTI